ncbi:hypothetical protein Misp01_27350 [Microtetraspora sp. NBRC 13810]|nr:hypothetical protein Misp01_27350 [Microtetraspora sp. NBRC 13810]
MADTVADADNVADTVADTVRGLERRHLPGLRRTVETRGGDPPGGAGRWVVTLPEHERGSDRAA